MKTIKVKNCHECPFCNEDNEFGKDQCNISEIYAGDTSSPSSNFKFGYTQMPANARHKDCPLNDEPVKIEAYLE